MRSSTSALVLACLLWAGAAQADPCDDFRALALMPRAVVATHEGGADPNWFDQNQKLSDLTLGGGPCTIGLVGNGTVAHVDCELGLNEGVTLDSFFDAVDECLKDKATKMSREPGQEDHIWTAGGAMVKVWGGDRRVVHVRFVY